MAMPESVVVCECWARDGLQSILRLTKALRNANAP